MSIDHPLIAVIDDEAAVRIALGRLLHSAGFSVELFEGGEPFLRSLETRRPDCAVLDLHMPEATGFDVLAQLGATGDLLPVVVMTGHDSPEAKEWVARCGAEYLLKPIRDLVLLHAINGAISRPHLTTAGVETGAKEPIAPPAP